MSSTKSAIPDAIFFELSPRIVFGVRIVNVVTLVMVLVTFILSLVRGNENPAYYLLACNTVISTLVGIVVNWWYKSGDLGSEKFWYVLVVAGVLLFQCITTDIYIYKVEEESPTTAAPATATFSWAPFRTTNRSLLHPPPSTTPLTVH